MKRICSILICLLLIPGLCGCGLFSMSEKPVTGKYYLAVRPDRKGKNTVLRVEDETIRLKVNGTVVLTAGGQEKEGRWEVERKRIRLIFDGETVAGRLEGERIEIGSSVYLRGKKAAETLWAEDAAAYVADPLAEYEGKYFLAGLLEDGENRVREIGSTTLWLMPEQEALLFESGKLTLLSWDAADGAVRIDGDGDSFRGVYENGRISGPAGGYTAVLLREEDEALAYLAEHPYVPKPVRPHVPALSGFEGRWYLGGASHSGKGVELEAAGLLRIELLADWAMTYEGQGFFEEGSYYASRDGRFEISFLTETLSGTIGDGRIDLNGTAGDHYIFFDDPDRADAFRLAENARIRAEEEPSRPDVPPETVPEVPSSEPDPGKETSAPAETGGQGSLDDADFWDGVWFGFVRLNDGCSGLYRMMRGKCYAVYAVLEMNEDGTGTLVGYDPAVTFSERLLSGKVRCQEDRTLTLTEGEIEAFHVSLENFTAVYDEERKLVSFSLTKSISGGAIGGELLLRRWGEGWEDLPEYMTLIPGYESYLEEIRSGVPRYGAD